MKKFILLVMGILIPASLLAEESVSSISICTPEWEYYTQKDGDGLYNELWDAVFESVGIRVDRNYAPFKRCHHEVKKLKRFDSFPAGYPEAGVTVPKWHLGVDLLSVVYRSGETDEWRGKASLEHKRVSWERGYELDKSGVVDVEVEVQEFDKLTSALRMLLANRTDYILDYEKAVRNEVAALGLSDQVSVRYNAITGPKFYMIFANTEKGRQLSAIWDDGIQQLYDSGVLDKVYKKYKERL